MAALPEDDFHYLLDEVVPPDPDLLDPHPDIHALFMHYNSLYFADRLGFCSVEWSTKAMTL